MTLSKQFPRKNKETTRESKLTDKLRRFTKMKSKMS